MRQVLAAGGRATFVNLLQSVIAERCDSCPGIDFEELCCDLADERASEFDTEGDLAMFRLLVSSVVLNMQSEVGIGQGSVRTGITPRKVPRKQKPPAWYVKRQKDAQAIIDGTVAPRVRTKYWNLRNISRSSQVGGGDFVCDFPGCGKCYTSKGGLSHHKLISHKVGTYRQAGFDCSLCPRSFEREMWLTRHTNFDHVLARPFVCPFCQGYWPGEPSLRLHIAADHRFEEKDFPAMCQLCINQGSQSQVFRSEHHFKYHLKREHL